MEFTELYERALAVASPRTLSEYTSVGVVGAAILTDKGNVYVGCNIDTACSMGYCAEHAAIAAMVTAGESRIVKVVAVNFEGKVYPPCGRCREFMYQINNENLNAEVMVEKDTILTLADILPYRWS